MIFVSMNTLTTFLFIFGIESIHIGIQNINDNIVKETEKLGSEDL